MFRLTLRVPAAVVIAFSMLVMGRLCPAQTNESAPRTRGFKPDKATQQQRYRKQWALVIGIDYVDRQPDVPRLFNAEEDARTVRDHCLAIATISPPPSLSARSKLTVSPTLISPN